MRSTLALVVAYAVVTLPLAAQGYSWEHSPREPYTISRTYIGLEAMASLAMYPARLEYIEQSSGLSCCTYGDGTGMPVAVSVVAERWVTSHVKLTAGAGVSTVSASFVAPTQPVPLSNGQILTTEYVLDGSLTYLSGFGSASLRLGTTHALVTLGARVHGYMAGSLTQKERVVSPQGVQFTGPQPGTEIVLGQSFLDHAAPLIVEPFVQLSYDVPLSYGVVLQPSIMAGLPVGSLSTKDDWRMRMVGVGLRLVKGL